jgi:S1-C subfamily serine protease
MVKILKSILIWGLTLLFSSQADVFAQTDGQGAGIDFQSGSLQGLGSVEQYDRDSWDSEDAEFPIPLIGIVVRNGLGKLASGQQLRGLGVTAVKGGGPADAAGVCGERGALRAVLVGTLFASSLVFPPALFGVVVVEQSGLGQPRDLIIAVDGARTRDIVEVENAIGKADAGEIVYLTIIRDGRRQQFRVKIVGDSGQ